MTKIYRHRKLTSLKTLGDPAFAQLGNNLPLSDLLGLMAQTGNGRLYLCGSLDQMSREYVEEPLQAGWEFAREYVHKYRSPVFTHPFLTVPKKQISIKLISESWFPGCEEMGIASLAWKTLRIEWEKTTKLPLLTTPSKTGQALLWESLPKNQDFPSLPDDLANHIRSISLQHRIEQIMPYDSELDRDDRDCQEIYEYDGRWMYAALAGLDRLPVGEPKEVSSFEPFQSGWYHVRFQIPDDWKHIGLIPVLDPHLGWTYPHQAGYANYQWVSEPELTLAQSVGWDIVITKGWRFGKGKPLRNWADKLIRMRKKFEDAENFPVSQVSDDLLKHFPDVAKYRYAGAAIREILNHTIGSFHAGGYERERFVSDADWPQWRRDNGWILNKRGGEAQRVEGGRLVPEIVPDESPLSIIMPHWSAQIWALERARVAQWALKCKLETLVRINGDAIYATEELPFEDNKNLGQLRRKGA